MADSHSQVIVVPGDQPKQIAESPHLERLREYGEIVLYRDRPATIEEKISRVRDADVILNSRGAVKWPGEILRQLPKLRMITTCGIGTDSIDLDVASERGIVVSNIPGKTAPVVAEHALALILGAARRLAYQTAELKAGRWSGLESVMARGKTLGVVGTGPIGRQMIRLGHALGMKVIAWTFHPSSERAADMDGRFVEFDELLRSSDFVSLHLKLTPESHHIIGERELGQMKPGSCLINTARGGLVATDALVSSLKSGHLGGAALDVFEIEPLPRDHPILSCEQVVLTPHNADQTSEGIDLLNAGATDNVIAFLSGSPQNVVT